MDPWVAKYAAIGAASVGAVYIAKASGCIYCGMVAGAVVGFAALALLAPVQGIVVAGDPVRVALRGDSVEP